MYGHVYSLYESERKYDQSKRIAKEQLAIAKLAFGEKSAPYAHACFLNAKSNMMSESDPNETLVLVN